MKNITVAIPNDIYHRARVWAAERDTSLSQVVAYVLENMMNQTIITNRFPKPTHYNENFPR